jgi:hypothetical protein
VNVQPVMAHGEWLSNGHLIADCARLGYLQPAWRTLDPTYGLGTFWGEWRPDELVKSDLAPMFANVHRHDVTALPWKDRAFDCVVLDLPYKLNGTPTQAVDRRYGVHEPARWQDRMGLLRAGAVECARVLGDGYLLVKCQDQVCAGRMRWQTDEITEAVRKVGLGKVDRLDFPSYRPQPEDDRVQRHARHNTSQLLIFKRGWWTSSLPKTPTPSGGN